jgi:hypothetical protein
MLMKPQSIQRHTTLLYISVLLACIYGGLLYFLGRVFGVAPLDGSLGVILGLFICSHPAANAVDVLFYERGELHKLTSQWKGVQWLLLNLFTMIVGWLVIVIGAIQLSAQ